MKPLESGLWLWLGFYHYSFSITSDDWSQQAVVTRRSKIDKVGVYLGCAAQRVQESDPAGKERGCEDGQESCSKVG